MKKHIISILSILRSVNRGVLAASFALFLLSVYSCHSHSHSDGHDHEAHAEHEHDHDGHDHEHEGHDHEHEGECDEGHDHGEEGHSDEIILTERQAKEAGLTTETVKAGTFADAIRVGGQLQATAEGEYTVTATADGIVTYADGVANEGAAVRGGQAVATISARNLQDGDPVEKARVTYETVKREYERAKNVAAKKIISQAELEAVADRYEKARLTYEALSNRMTASGISIVSPANGYVKSRLAKQGAFVSMGDPLLTVTKTRRLQLRAEVPERDFGRLKNISSANFSCPGTERVYSLSSLNGRLLSYGRASAAESFYIPVTFEFDNVGDFVTGAFVEVWLLGQPRNNVISVPVSALTEEQGVYYVYLKIKDEDEAYMKREVKTGASNGSRIEIKSGLAAGDIVVTHGATQVKLASLKVMPEGHVH